MPETRKYTVADLFAGVGGLSYGFSRNDRFEIILANEMQKDIAKAYTLNHPAVNMLQGDIKDLSEDVLRQTIGNRTVDVVVGGPPCQSYSTLGKRQMDARANLFMEYKRVLCILHPRAFLFENVKGILSMDKGALFEHVRKEFEDALMNKLQEEVAELLEAYTAKKRSVLDCAEEMADVMEVMYAMGKTCAVSRREVEQVRSQKAAEKGTFSKKIFLVSTEK